jgi:hypothetical protein
MSHLNNQVFKFTAIFKTTLNSFFLYSRITIKSFTTTKELHYLLITYTLNKNDDICNNYQLINKC